MWSNKFILLAMNIFTMPSPGNTKFSILYNIVLLYFPSPVPGQALLGFHENGPKRDDVSLYVLPDCTCVKRARFGIKRARPSIGIQRGPGMQRGWPGMQRARPGIGIQLARPCMQRARPASAFSARGPACSARGPASAHSASGPACSVCAPASMPLHDGQKSITVAWRNVSSSRTPSWATSEGAPAKHNQKCQLRP